MKFNRIIATFLVVVIFVALWQWLEMSIYGAVEPRVVDDILILFLTPVFYCAVSYVCDKIEYKRIKKREDEINVVFDNRRFSSLDGNKHERG